MGRRRAIFITTIASGASDTTAPTVAITCAQTSPSATTPLNFTFTLSEPSTDFAVGDITAAISGGTVTKSNFAGSGASYTCDLAPSVAGTMTVDVAAGAFTDAAGNENTAATQFTFTFILLLFHDTFTTADAAPIATPRTAEPGPGTAVIEDTNNIMSLASGKLVVNGTGVNNEGYSESASRTRAGGLCMAALMSAVTTLPNVTFVGWGASAAGDVRSAFILKTSGGGFFCNILISNYTLPAVIPGYPLTIYSILQSTGTLYVAGDKFILAENRGTGNLYAGIGVRSGSASDFSADAVKVASLPAPWNTIDGIATASNQSPTTGATISHDTSGYIFFEWTCATSEVLVFEFRRTDDNNRWYVECHQANSTLKVFEVNDGVTTERATKAQTWVNARIYQIVVGNNVAAANHVWANAFEVSPGAGSSAAITYTSATFNASVTTSKVSGFATGGFYVSYPYTVPAAALAILQAF